MDFLGNIFYGIVGGVIIAASGYLKNVKKEKFDAKKALETIALGGLAGLILTLLNLNDLSENEIITTSSVVAYVIQNFYKFVMLKK